MKYWQGCTTLTPAPPDMSDSQNELFITESNTFTVFALILIDKDIEYNSAKLCN